MREVGSTLDQSANHSEESVVPARVLLVVRAV